MRRQVFCISFLGVFLLCFAAPCLSQSMGGDMSRMFTADVLKTTLFAKTAQEKQFCDYVIQKRDDGTLPYVLLYAVHQKSLTKDRGRRFAYFKSSLEIACRREGIRL